MGGRLLRRGRGGVALSIDRTLEPVFWALSTLVAAVISHPAPLQLPHTPPHPVSSILPAERACQFGVGEAVV